jgi:hypothetical protein
MPIKEGPSSGKAENKNASSSSAKPRNNAASSSNQKTNDKNGGSGSNPLAEHRAVLAHYKDLT